MALCRHHNILPKNAAINKGGVESIDEVYEKGLNALSPQQFEDTANQTGAIMLDTRDPQVFAKGFIPNSINIGLNGQFAPWVGALITDLQQPILLITDQGKEEETITRLTRVGYDSTIGYLAGGFENWTTANKEIDTIESISAENL